MKVLFAFENPLPSNEADAEVFTTTARYLARHVQQSWLHLPLAAGTAAEPAARIAGMPVVRAWAPVRPAALRHLLCGLTLIFRREFRRADIIYTRNLWVAWMSVLARRRVVFDHYRPWGDQIPPLQFWIHRLHCHPRFLLNICHSDYTRRKYLDLGVPAAKLHCVRNGFEPARLQAPVAPETAKRQIGVRPDQATVVYTGRLNHKKGLDLVLQAARILPDILFILVGSTGPGPIESMAAGRRNIRIVAFRPDATLAQYIFAADILLIPPSHKPLATFGSTVLPLKLFLYMASGRPIVGGDTPDVREVLTHRCNAWLCRPDCVASLVGGIRAVIGDRALASRIAAQAGLDSRDLTWDARARRIAELIAANAAAQPRRHGQWSARHSRTWLRQSGRWLAHLARTRAWVLPPAPLA
ncbi:glycosyltransferase family 4 protein [Lichenicoccus sp.]|uniref:glycosyltransferase family 4 protein n=1 Tax=Lichenicoccus sp. TaxID=2781899 RepID=UPI003D0A8730